MSVQQPDLFDTPPRPLREAMRQARETQRLARRADPETSKQAAREATSFLTEQEQKIVDALKADASGLICEEIGARIGLADNQVARRMSTLEERHLVGLHVWRKGGVVVRTETRKNHRGKPCRVWYPRAIVEDEEE